MAQMFSSKSCVLSMIIIVFSCVISIQSKSIRTKRWAVAESILHRRRRDHLNAVLKNLRIIYHQSRNGVAYIPEHAETDGQAVSPDRLNVIITKYLGEDFPVRIQTEDRPRPSRTMDRLIELSLQSDMQNKVINRAMARTIARSQRQKSSWSLHSGDGMAAASRKQKEGAILKVYKIERDRMEEHELQEMKEIYSFCQRINMARSQRNLKLRCDIVPSEEDDTK